MTTIYYLVKDKAIMAYGARSNSQHLDFFVDYGRGGTTFRFI